MIFRLWCALVSLLLIWKSLSFKEIKEAPFERRACLICCSLQPCLSIRDYLEPLTQSGAAQGEKL